VARLLHSGQPAGSEGIEGVFDGVSEVSVGRSHLPLQSWVARGYNPYYCRQGSH